MKRYDPATNPDLNGVTKGGILMGWARAYPRNYAEQFKGIEPGSVPDYRKEDA